MSKEFEEECIKFYGKVLTGKFAHWCYEWDGLPIDETCEEFKCCCCYADIDPNDERSVATDDAILTDAGSPTTIPINKDSANQAINSNDGE
jgi:hypothetical protein